MTWYEISVLALAVTATMAAVDYATARYSLAMVEVRHLQNECRPYTRSLLVASMWSVIQWGAACVAFVVNVKVSMWFLPFEALGLFVGTLIGGRRRTVRGVNT